MTFTDILGHSSKLFHSFSMKKKKKRKDQHRTLKRLNTVVGNLVPPEPQTTDLEDSKEQIQQQNSSLYPPLAMTISDLSRSISNRSITFASIFDEQKNENNNHTTFDPDTSLDNEDLVIVVPNKYVHDEPILNNSNPEPYPFRSEIPLSLLSKSHSSANINQSSHSKRKSLHLLVPHHRAKKLRHPIKTIQSVNSTDRSKSTPNLLFSSLSTSTTNDHPRSLTTIRQWFKSSSVGRLIQSFISHPTTSNTKHLKQNSPVKLITSEKYSDLIY